MYDLEKIMHVVEKVINGGCYWTIYKNVNKLTMSLGVFGTVKPGPASCEDTERDSPSPDFAQITGQERAPRA